MAELTCLRCAGVALLERHGALLEAVCPRCHGRFFDEAGARRLLVDVAGLDAGLLVELSRMHPGPARCPSCAQRMGLVPLRGVPVDLCAGCGGLYLDAGELSRLSRGSIEEVRAAAPGDEPPVTSAALFSNAAAAPEPAPLANAAALPSDDAAGGGASLASRERFAVFLHTPAPPPEAIVEAFRAAGFRTLMDARIAAQRAVGGVVVDELESAEASALADALRAAGAPAEAVLQGLVDPPHALRTKELRLLSDALEVTDPLGRPRRLELGDVRAIAAASAAVITTEPNSGSAGDRAAAGSAGGGHRFARAALRTLGPGAGAIMKAAGALGRDRLPGTSLVESRELYLDLVLERERLRLNASGLIRRAGQAKSLGELAAALHSFLPAAVARHRGIDALFSGKQAPALKSLRELDREVAWTLWHARPGTARSSGPGP